MWIEGIVLKDHADLTLDRIQIGYLLISKVDVPLGRESQAGDQHKGGGLAATRRPQDGHQFPFWNDKVNIVQNCFIVKCHLNILELHLQEDHLFKYSWLLASILVSHAFVKTSHIFG